MKLLIDGYNLLHQSPVMQSGTGAKWLQQQRDRLVHSLASMLPPDVREETVIVFDAHSGKSASTVDKTIEGIRVRFAHHYREADDLIEEIIDQHPNPQSLVVISSDRRLERAAKSRRAKVIGGRAWFDSLQTENGPREEPLPIDPEEIKNVSVDATQVEKWIEIMGLQTEAVEEQNAPQSLKTSSIANKKRAIEVSDSNKPIPKQNSPTTNKFTKKRSRKA